MTLTGGTLYSFSGNIWLRIQLMKRTRNHRVRYCYGKSERSIHLYRHGSLHSGVSGPEHYLPFLLAVIRLPIREAAEAKITPDKVPSSTAASCSNWFCVFITKFEENIFIVRPWKLCCPPSVSKSNVHISIYLCFSLNAQLPCWHRTYLGKQRAQRGEYHFGLNCA